MAYPSDLIQRQTEMLDCAAQSMAICRHFGEVLTNTADYNCAMDDIINTVRDMLLTLGMVERNMHLVGPELKRLYHDYRSDALFHDILSKTFYGKLLQELFALYEPLTLLNLHPPEVIAAAEQKLIEITRRTIHTAGSWEPRFVFAALHTVALRCAELLRAYRTPVRHARIYLCVMLTELKNRNPQRYAEWVSKQRCLSHFRGDITPQLTADILDMTLRYDLCLPELKDAWNTPDPRELIEILEELLLSAAGDRPVDYADWVKQEPLFVQSDALTEQLEAVAFEADPDAEGSYANLIMQMDPD